MQAGRSQKFAEGAKQGVCGWKSPSGVQGQSPSGSLGGEAARSWRYIPNA